MTDLQALIRELQAALNVRVEAGQILLNMNDGRLASVEVRMIQRVKPMPTIAPALLPLDKCGGAGA